MTTMSERADRLAKPERDLADKEAFLARTEEAAGEGHAGQSEPHQLAPTRALRA